MPSFVLEVAICKQSINQILFYQKKKSNIRTELAIVSKKKKREQNLPFESPTQLYHNRSKLKQNFIHLSPTQARFLTASKWWIQD